VSGPGGARRGPRRLSGDAVRDFLQTARPAALCVEDESGELVAMPVRVVRAGDGELRLAPAGPWWASGAAGRGGPGCVVADEFETYEGIRGVIVQGDLRPVRSAPPGGTEVVLAVSTAVGFTFAGTLPPELAGSAVEEP
jgi:hypothetical protein